MSFFKRRFEEFVSTEKSEDLKIETLFEVGEDLEDAKTNSWKHEQ